MSFKILQGRAGHCVVYCPVLYTQESIFRADDCTAIRRMCLVHGYVKTGWWGWEICNLLLLWVVVGKLGDSRLAGRGGYHGPEGRLHMTGVPCQDAVKCAGVEASSSIDGTCSRGRGHLSGSERSSVAGSLLLRSGVVMQKTLQGPGIGYHLEHHHLVRRPALHDQEWK